MFTGLGLGLASSTLLGMIYVLWILNHWRQYTIASKRSLNFVHSPCNVTKLFPYIVLQLSVVLKWWASLWFMIENKIWYSISLRNFLQQRCCEWISFMEVKFERSKKKILCSLNTSWLLNDCTWLWILLCKTT